MQPRFQRNLHSAEKKEIPLRKKGNLSQVCLFFCVVLMEGLRPIWGCTLYKDPSFVPGFTVDTVLRLTGGVWYVECLCTYISIYKSA